MKHQQVRQFKILHIKHYLDLCGSNMIDALSLSAQLSWRHILWNNNIATANNGKSLLVVCLFACLLIIVVFFFNMVHIHHYGK